MKKIMTLGLVIAGLWALQACGSGSSAEDRAKFVADSIAQADSIAAAALADSIAMADSLAQAYIADSLARLAQQEGVSGVVVPASKPATQAPTRPDPKPKAETGPDKVDAGGATDLQAGNKPTPSKGGSRTDVEEPKSGTPSKGGSRTDVQSEKPKKPKRPTKGGSRTEGEGSGGR